MADDLFDVEVVDDRPAAIVLRVRVQPGAGRASIVGRHGDALSVRVAAPPIDGRANAASLDLVAEFLGVRKSEVELVSGERGRMKRFRVTGIEPDQARDRIARELRATATGRGPSDRADRQGKSRP